MNRIAAPLCLALAASTLVACGGGGGSSRSASTASAVSTASPTSATTTTTSSDSLLLWTLTPDRGDARGGVEVTLRGQGFAAGAEVRFGGEPATDVVVASADTIVCKTPALPSGGGAVDVRIEQPDGSETLLAAAFLPSAVATPRLGELDPSFGGAGYVTHDLGTGARSYDHLLGLTIDAADRIVAVGYGGPLANGDLVVRRFLPDGSPDAGFASGGLFSHDDAAGGARADRGTSVALDAQGRIVVAGYSRGTADDDLVVWRLSPSGALDDTFANGQGFLVDRDASGTPGADQGLALALDDQGRILVAGRSDDRMALWRFLPSGQRDVLFGSGGVVLGAAGTYARAVAVDAQGAILVAGRIGTGAAMDLAVWRFDGDGIADASFGGQGFFSHDGAAGGAGTDQAYALTLDPIGRIVISGSSRSASNTTLAAVWRLLPNGVLDTSLDGDGAVALEVSGSSSNIGRALAVDPAGKIVVAGSCIGTGTDLAVWQLEPTGALDAGFATGGVLTHHGAAGGTSTDLAYGAVLDADNRLVLSGMSYSTEPTSEHTLYRIR